MLFDMMKLILASASPRRRELLQLAGYDYEAVVSRASEDVPPAPPEEYVCALAHRKAEAVFAEHSEDCVVGADTIVYLGGRIIGKPRDEEDAFRILTLLSGKTHTVYTGVAVLSPSGEQVFCDAARVTFAALGAQEIRRYIASGEPMDKAGAYGIQGPASVFVDRIEGCYFTVIGMPMPRLYRALRQLDILPVFRAYSGSESARESSCQ